MKPDDSRQALEALLRGEGMSDAELEALVAQELIKGDEMDADLVAEVANEAEGAHLPAFDATANWAAIEKNLDRRKHSGAFRRWTLAAAAVLVVIVFATLGATVTDAGRWDYLVKVFRPIAETLGIHVRIDDVGSVADLVRPDDTEAAPSDAEQEAKSQTILDEHEVPTSVRGTAAKPSWLPKGYTFCSAEVYDDYNESSITIFYRKDSAELFVQTVVYAQNDELTATNVLAKDDKETEVAHAITFTENNGVVSAVHEDNLALHMVWGRLSREEISQVITSIQ
jgi:hypothetical protein